MRAFSYNLDGGNTMKKFIAISLSFLFVLFFLASCTTKPAAPKAGLAKAEDMLSLLPKEAMGVIVVDVHSIMKTEAADKAIKENKAYQKYQEFVQKTGLDPQKDVYFFVGAMLGDFSQKSEDGVGLVNLKYNKELLLAAVQKERGELAKTEYNGFTIYQAAQTEEKKPFSGTFLDDSNIIIGTDYGVKKVIDVYQKKADNIWKNETLPALIKGMNKAAMVWGGFAIPPEAMKQASSQNPMLGAFSDIKSIIMSFDYRNKNILVEIKAMSPDPEKNKQMAAALNGFKALGAGAAAKEPLLGELLNKIEISSEADHVNINAGIPEELLRNLTEKVKVKKAKPETEKQD
jgi:hypothetical protein